MWNCMFSEAGTSSQKAQKRRCPPVPDYSEKDDTKRLNALATFLLPNEDFIASSYEWAIKLHLDYAREIAKLASTRAMTVLEAQLDLVSSLQEKRAELSKLKDRADRVCKVKHRELSQYIRSHSRYGTLSHLKERISSLESLLAENPTLLYQHATTDASERVSPRMKSLFQDTVKKVVLEAKKDKVRSTFDRILKQKGLTTEQLRSWETIFQTNTNRSNVSQFSAKYKMFFKKDSLEKVHKNQQTISTEKLLALLKDHPSTPLVNILEWKHLKMAEIDSEGISLANIEASKVNWVSVAETLWYDESCFWTPNDCHVVWDLYIRPELEEIRKPELLEFLKEVVEAGKVDWKELSEQMGKNFTPKKCKELYEKHLYEKHFVQKEGDVIKRRPLTHSQQMEKLHRAWSSVRSAAVQTFDRFNGSFSYLAAQLNNLTTDCTFTPSIAKQFYLQSQRFVYSRNTRFSLAEDAILLVTLEKLKPIIQRTGKFCLQKYLPWRMANEWKLRLRFLAQEWQDRFTIQEDMRLIYLANQFSGDWVEMSNYFVGKSRKALRGRYRSLQRYLLGDRGNLIDFNRSTFSKKGGIHYPHVKRCIQFLFNICVTSSLIWRHFEFKGFSRDRPPSNLAILAYLLTMDRAWLMHTCRELIHFCIKYGLPSHPVVPCVKPDELLTESVTGESEDLNFEEILGSTDINPTTIDSEWTYNCGFTLFKEFLMEPIDNEPLSPEGVFPNTPEPFELRDFIETEIIDPTPNKHHVPTLKEASRGRGKKMSRLKTIRKEAAQARWAAQAKIKEELYPES